MKIFIKFKSCFFLIFLNLSSFPIFCWLFLRGFQWGIKSNILRVNEHNEDTCLDRVVFFRKTSETLLALSFFARFHGFLSANERRVDTYIGRVFSDKVLKIGYAILAVGF